MLQPNLRYGTVDCVQYLDSGFTSYYQAYFFSPIHCYSRHVHTVMKCFSVGYALCQQLL